MKPATLIRKGTLDDVLYLSNIARQDESNRMAKNYSMSLESNTLLHSFLYKENFDKNFSVVEKEGLPVACASFYSLENYAVLLSRSYVVREHRNNWHLTELLERQLVNCDDNVLRVCFNSPTASFYEYIRRKSNSYLPNIWYKFLPIGKHVINNTEQYVIEYDRTIST